MSEVNADGVLLNPHEALMQEVQALPNSQTAEEPEGLEVDKALTVFAGNGEPAVAVGGVPHTPVSAALAAPALFRRMGLQLTQGFQTAAKAHGFDLVVSGEPALFYLRIANDDSLMLHQEWVAECVSRGLFLASHHNHFLYAAITDEDIALAIDIANDAFSVVAARHPELALKK